MKQVIIEDVLNIINASLGDDKVSQEQLSKQLPDLGMDSITFIQMIVALEEAYECEIPDSKLLISEMDTAQKVFDLLQSLYIEIEGIIND